MKKLWFLIILPLILISCRENHEDMPTGPLGVLQLDVQNLPTLTNGSYALWISGKENSFIGSFQIDENGKPDPSVFEYDYETINNAVVTYITIEPNGAGFKTPSKGKVLFGFFGNRKLKYNRKDTAYMDINNVKVNFRGSFPASGSYILATPTDSNFSNEFSGVWLARYAPDDTVQSVFLPALDGWVYQAWLDFDSLGVLNMGQFPSGDSKDDASLYGGPYPGFPFPGEDFLNNSPDSMLKFPADLSGYTLKISIEPADLIPDDQPFRLIYKSRISPFAIPGMDLPLDYVYDSLPFPVGQVRKFPPGEYLP